MVFEPCLAPISKSLVAADRCWFVLLFAVLSVYATDDEYYHPLFVFPHFLMSELQKVMVWSFLGRFGLGCKTSQNLNFQVHPIIF